MSWEKHLFIARPAAKKAPVVIVLQEIFGINEHIQSVCQRVAEAGYVAVAPDLFRRTAGAQWVGDFQDFSKSMPHAQALTPAILEEDIRSAYDWIKADAQADEARAAAWGFCLGGRLSVIANALLPLKCAVSYYGGVTDALMPYVAKAAAPQMFAWGGKDKHIGPVNARRIVDAFREAGKSFVDVEFGDADHGFFRDADKAPAKQAWALTKAFFETHLTSV